jgi:hypothetical protein
MPICQTDFKPKLVKRDKKGDYRSGTVVHTYNSNYAGGGDQEEHSLRLFQAKSQ